MFLKVRLLIVLSVDYYAFILQHNPFTYEGKHLLYNFEWILQNSHFPLVLYA